jgi:hypothetical protein
MKRGWELSFDKTKSSLGDAAKLFVVCNLLALSLLGQDTSPMSQNHSQSRALPEFDYTQGWLGADDAYSVPIGPNKSVWLFGDTFVGSAGTKLRNQAKTMVHNSIGISECEPGTHCTLNYSWHDPNSPKPRSFFDTGTDNLYYWPLDGFREGRTLYLSLLAVRNKPGAKLGDAFGFEIVGTKMATIDNVQAPPEKWRVSIQDLTDASLWTGASLVPDGKYVIWYTEVSEGEGRGFMTEMRLPRNKMAKPSGNWEYLNKDNHWVAGLAGKDAMHVIEQPISEMSVRYHPSIKKWLALSPGPDFPSAWAVVRSADSPVGPWSSPQKIYEFPEMRPDNPGYDKDTFCYAVKEHIEFSVAKIALTYACNSMVLSKTMANMNIYRPRAVVLDLPK